MSSPNTSLAQHLSQKISPFGLKMWEIIGISFGALLLCALSLLAMCACCQNRRRYKRASGYLPTTKIPEFSRDIKEVPVEKPIKDDSVLLEVYDGSSDNDSNKGMNLGKLENGDSGSNSGSFHYVEKHTSSNSTEVRVRGKVDVNRQHSAYPTVAPQLSSLPEFSHLGWGHWFTLRDLEIATNWFSKDNILGEGGYGVVYRGQLMNGTQVAIKRLLNNLGQAEKEFRVEVEAIGHVRHKNLVRLLGYCVEGTQRMLVYEYVNNGNLEQWLHGAMEQKGSLTWDARMKIILGTAKALAYLHEAVEPKVVHRDIKSSNILIDEDFNAKVSDFGLAKLLGSGKSHITTRVMGTFGYVAPEYANTGLLNEKSDIYSFGVLLLEAITGRDPIDYGRPPDEVNLVDWLKWMIANRRSEEVVDPIIVTRPSSKALKKALLTALKCVDLDSEKRPKMGRVVQMLELDNSKSHEDQRHHHDAARKRDTESQMKDSDTNAKSDIKSEGTRK
ncbi:putative receptor-like protein kinase [Canna indica]|uniref:non-specific serine/threonine protein kinase n=1 Tax=Canna indica TaxID=4628 RepID=A0AAQ3KQG1_9LILI|nr:putative receptor-like protein kinase [Canna indica]